MEPKPKIIKKIIIIISHLAIIWCLYIYVIDICFCEYIVIFLQNNTVECRGTQY